MGDSYVCSGATLRCSMGDQTAKLTVLPNRTVFLCGKPMANIDDHVSMINLAPFGRCRSLGFPVTASATAANFGKLTPMPCVHNTPTPWIPGKTDFLIKSKPALLKSCHLQCIWGGNISIDDNGQKEMYGQNADIRCIDFSKDSSKQSDLSNELDFATVLNGIQLALDVAGLTPGIGAIADLTNAAIYAIRGDEVNAGLSLLSAVPGLGDTAAAVRLIGKVMKTAKVAIRSKKTAKALETFKTNTKLPDSRKTTTSTIKTKHPESSRKSQSNIVDSNQPFNPAGDHLDNSNNKSISNRTHENDSRYKFIGKNTNSKKESTQKSTQNIFQSEKTQEHEKVEQPTEIDSTHGNSTNSEKQPTPESLSAQYNKKNNQYEKTNEAMKDEPHKLNILG